MKNRPLTNGLSPETNRKYETTCMKDGREKPTVMLFLWQQLKKETWIYSGKRYWKK